MAELGLRLLRLLLIFIDNNGDIMKNKICSFCLSIAALALLFSCKKRSFSEDSKVADYSFTPFFTDTNTNANVLSSIPEIGVYTDFQFFIQSVNTNPMENLGTYLPSGYKKSLFLSWNVGIDTRSDSIELSRIKITAIGRGGSKTLVSKYANEGQTIPRQYSVEGYPVSCITNQDGTFEFDIELEVRMKMPDGNYRREPGPRVFKIQKTPPFIAKSERFNGAQSELCNRIYY